MLYSTPKLYNSGMFDTSDYFKILLLNNIYIYLNYLETNYKLKLEHFQLLVKNKYFTNNNIDKNIYLNKIKQSNSKIIKIKSFLNYYKKHFIIEAQIFCKINYVSKKYIASFL